MTSTISETIVPAPEPTPNAQAPLKAARSRSVLPLLERLFELYPVLFGAEFLPLKRGIFQELLAAHPADFERDTLKAALAAHARSTRYLQCVASGKMRHDLQGVAVEAVAPEHVHLAMLELFRRRQGRSKDDLRPWARAQFRAAFTASGLSRQDYLACVQTRDDEANALLEEALAEHDQIVARHEALRRAFESSGKTAEEFAAMYGLSLRDVNAVLARS